MRSIVSCVIFLHISARLASSQPTGGTSTSGYNLYTSNAVELAATSTRTSLVLTGTSTARFMSPTTRRTDATSMSSIYPDFGSMMSGSPIDETNPSFVDSTVRLTSASTGIPTTAFNAGNTKLLRSFSNICSSFSAQHQRHVWIPCAKFRSSPRTDRPK